VHTLDDTADYMSDRPLNVSAQERGVFDDELYQDGM